MLMLMQEFAHLKNTFKEALTKPSLQGLTTCAGPDVRVCCPLLLYLFIDIILLLFHAPFSRIPALFLGISYSRRVSRQGLPLSKS
jgi:hypothetical protein